MQNGLTGKIAIVAMLAAVFIGAAMLASHTVLATELSTTNPNDYFVALLENKASIGQGYAIFEVRNPLATAITISPSNFYTELDTFQGKPATTSLLTERIYSNEYTTLENVCNRIDNGEVSENGSAIITQECSQVPVFHNDTISKYESFDKPIILDPGQIIKVKLFGTWEVSNSNSREWYPVLNLSSSSIKQSAWASWAFNLSYCTNIAVQVENFNYMENQTVLSGFVNFTSGGTSPLPYNDSIRLASAPCNQGGQELPSALWPIVQNSTGHVSYGYLVIKQNGTVSSNITYGVYYNTRTVGIASYPTDLKVESKKITNSYLQEEIYGGGIAVTSPIGEANWESGFYGKGDNIYNGSGGTGDLACGYFYNNLNLTFNSSVLAVFRCLATSNNGVDNMQVFHIYYAYSPLSHIYITDTGMSPQTLEAAFRPQGSIGGTVYKFDKKYYDNAIVIGAAERGIIGGMSNVTTNNSIFYLWNGVYNQSLIVGDDSVATNLRINPGQNESIKDRLITKVYVYGLTNDLRIQNATNFWEGFVHKPIQFTSGNTTAEHFWDITFNVTGSQENNPSLDNVNITCNYPGFNQNGDTTNLYGPFIFSEGTWNCTFSKSSSYYFDKSQSFVSDSNKIVNVVIPETGGATYQEHTWLEAIYNCVIQKQCDLYNLLLNINQTIGYTWQQVKPTDKSVVLNETITSSILDSTHNITIQYNISIPVKQGYSLGDYLPVRIGFWFLNQTNGTCYSQGTLPNGVTLISPYCNPLMVQTLGPMGGTTVFRVDLRPNLTAGSYNLTRIIEIDPNDAWNGYGQEEIGTIFVGQDNSDLAAKIYSLEGQSTETAPVLQTTETRSQNTTQVTNIYNTYNYPATGNATNVSSEFVVLIGLIILVLLTIIFYLYRKKKK